MSSKVDVFLTLARVLSRVEITNNDLARFAALAFHIRSHGGTIADACEATALEMTHQVLMIVATSMIANWNEQGAEAALSLPDFDDFDTLVAADDSPDRGLIKHAIKIIRLMAWADMGDRDKLRESGKALLELTTYILRMNKDQVELAISVSLLSRDILDQFDDNDAALGQLYAYRMLVSPRQLPFLPDLPPMKYPPPIAPALDKNTLLELCLEFIRQGLLNQPIDLSASAIEMREDSEIAIKHQIQLVLENETKTIKVEMALGRNLIDWALEDDAELGAGICANDKLRALLTILCENKKLLEGFSDDDLGYVYQIPYLGLNEPPPKRLDLCLKIESIKDIVRCTVGLSISEVRMNTARDFAFASRRNALLSHISANVAGES